MLNISNIKMILQTLMEFIASYGNQTLNTWTNNYKLWSMKRANRYAKWQWEKSVILSIGCSGKKFSKKVPFESWRTGRISQGETVGAGIGSMWGRASSRQKQHGQSPEARTDCNQGNNKDSGVAIAKWAKEESDWSEVREVVRWRSLGCSFNTLEKYIVDVLGEKEKKE